MLKSSKHPKEAQQFVAYLTGPDGPAGPGRQHGAGVPDRQRRAGEREAQAAVGARPAGRRPLHAQRSRGHRADAAGRPALTRSTPGRAVGDGDVLSAAGVPDPRLPHRRRRGAAAVAALTLIPLVYVAGVRLSEGWDAAYQQLVRPRVGELLSNTVRLVVAAMVASAVLGTGHGLADRAHRPARPPGVERPAGRAAGGTGVRQQLRVGVADPRGRGLRRCRAHRHPVVLPAGLPARRGDPARPRPRPRGDRPRARARPDAPIPPGGPATAAPGDARRHPAGRPAPAGRVRGAADAALPDLHHRHLRPVPVHLQRPHRQHARQRPGHRLLLLLMVELRLRGRGRYARLGSGARPARDAGRLGWRSPAALAAVTGVVALALGVPLGSLVYWLATGTSTGSPSPIWSPRRPPPSGSAPPVRRSPSRSACRSPGWRCAGPAAEHRHRAGHLHRPRAARDHRRPRAGHHLHPLHPALYQTTAAAGRLRHPVLAPRRREPPRRPGPGATAPRRRRPRPRRSAARRLRA